MSEQVRDSYVSIHAPVKVRQETFLQGHDLVSFNSRTCEGATLCLSFVGYYTEFQFTHL